MMREGKKNNRSRRLAAEAGLTAAEAAKRSAISGLNQLPSAEGKNFFDSLLAILRDPMFLLLLAAAAIYFALGDFRDATIFLSLTVCLIILTLYQERKTERALKALKELAAPLAMVWRDGKKQKLDSRYLVLGDIVELAEGGLIPADGVILEEQNLLVSEAVLTGEAVPVKKTVWDKKEKLLAPGGEDLPFVFSGTTVLRGRALMQVTAIASQTEIGKIGTSLAAIKETPTLLEQEIRRLIKWFALYGGAISLLVVFLFVLLKNDWLSGLLNGLSLAMSVLPEELSVIIVVFMALGAWRMAKSKALAKKGAAIETLGAVSVLCVDKTGTLTHNSSKLSVVSIGAKKWLLNGRGKRKKQPAAVQEILRAAYLACAEHTHDPLEMAIKDRAAKEINLNRRVLGLKHLREYPLSRELFAMTNAWQNKRGKIEATAKGAPEAIANLCHLTVAEIEAMSRQMQALADEGLRVLAVARASHSGAELPLDHHHFDFEFLGLIGFVDPIRKQVPAAVAECHQAGVRVIMITGDYPLTAQYIARKIGLNNAHDYITGEQLKHLTKAQLRQKIERTDIFARVLPEQKLRIVEALKANGEIVGMTGDGVNDAPALKAAHIGIAMGERGTDVARETADLILLNDDFSTIVKAIKMGRMIFDNLRKATAFIFAIHLPIAGLAILPLAAGLPVFFFPIHIAFMELIVDPTCSLVFETEAAEPGIMKRPPRNLKQPMLDQRTFIKSLLQGLGVLLVVFFTYLALLNFGHSVESARTIAFIALTLGNLALIVANLSYGTKLSHLAKEKNWPLIVVAASSLLLVGAAVAFSPLREIFHFAVLEWPALAVALLAAVCSALWLRLLKLVLPVRF